MGVGVLETAFNLLGIARLAPFVGALATVSAVTAGSSMSHFTYRALVLQRSVVDDQGRLHRPPGLAIRFHVYSEVTMRTMTSIIVCGAALVMAGAVAGLPSESSARAYPAFILLRLPGADTSTLILHGKLPTVRVGDRLIPRVDSSPIHKLYNSLEVMDPGGVDKVPGRRVVEVAEFMGPQWYELIDENGHLSKRVHFEEATARSWIHVDAGGASLVWVNPIVQPIGARSRVLKVSAAGEQVLADYGVGRAGWVGLGPGR